MSTEQHAEQQACVEHLPDLGRNIKGVPQRGRFLHLVIDLEERLTDREGHQQLSESEKSVIIAGTGCYGKQIPGTNITLQLSCYIKAHR